MFLPFRDKQFVSHQAKIRLFLFRHVRLVKKKSKFNQHSRVRLFILDSVRSVYFFLSNLVTEIAPPPLLKVK